MQKREMNVTAGLGGSALQAVSGVTVTVTNDATGLPVALYSDNGVTLITAPIVTDTLGFYSYYAADGKYTETLTGLRLTAPVLRQIILEDPADNPVATLGQLGASGGAGLIGTQDGNLSESIKLAAVASGPRDAILYNGAHSVRVFRSFAIMGGFRFRGQYTKGRSRTFPMPASRVASTQTDLGGMTAPTFENWYAVFACANNNDATATIKVMPFLRAGTVAGSNVPLIRAGENIHALTAQSYAWSAANNLANTDCLVISEGGGFSGRVAKITANSASQITLDTIGSVAAYDFLLPAPPGYTNYVYLGSFYYDTAEVRNLYDSGTVAKAKMIFLTTPSVATGAFAPGVTTSKTLNCAGYICPLATAVVIDSSANLSTASVGTLAEYFDPDGANHIVQTCYIDKTSGTSQTYVFDNIQIPFLYFQTFNYSNAGSLAATRVSGQLNIVGWIEP